jgi:hypothetical protein
VLYLDGMHASLWFAAITLFGKALPLFAYRRVAENPYHGTETTDRGLVFGPPNFSLVKYQDQNQSTQIGFGSGDHLQVPKSQMYQGTLKSSYRSIQYV